MEFIDEILLASDMLYQNQDKICISWVEANCNKINVKLQESAERVSQRRQISVNESLKDAMEILEELVEVLKLRNTLELADCLKYKVADYIKLGEV